MKHGWLFDVPDPRDFDVRSLTKTCKAKTGSADQTSLRCERGFQRTTASCFAFAASRGLYQLLQMEGYTVVPQPSVPWIYDIARQQEQAGKPVEAQQPLVDVGCYPHLGLKALKRQGFVSSHDMPFSPDTINQRPSPAVVVKAYPQRGLTYYRIWDWGDERVKLGSAAMKRGAMILGMRVCEGFEQHVGEGTIGHVDLDHSAGHGLTALAIRQDDGALLVDNWWEGWGIQSGPLAGCGWIDRRVWTHPMICPDVFVLTGARLQ